MSKKTITGSLVCGAMLFMGVTGITPPAFASNVVDLTMWQQWGGGHEEAALDKVIKEYESLNPGVR